MSDTTKAFLWCGTLGLVILYAAEHRTKPNPKPVNTVATNSTLASNPYLQAAFSNAIWRIQDDLRRATNAEEIAKLRAAEHTLTNTLR